MDVFGLRQQVIQDYGDYVRSFIHIRDERINSHVERELRDGLLWPEPLLQLNPAFALGGSIRDLVQEHLLDGRCEQIFALKAPGKESEPISLYRHQREAIEAAVAGDSYVMTTGTGSGKSLSYIIPIVDHVLRHGSGQGTRALVIYPMNALANSQMLELDKYLKLGFEAGKPPVTFERYTGQEGEEARQRIIERPPDIILTNYVMAELLLTRLREAPLIAALQKSLRFLVLDEMHTYRGRQGADVAMLVRRIRNLCENRVIQCVGTSATLAGGGAFAQQQEEVARVATTLFGLPVKPTRVIGETLRRLTAETPLPSAGTNALLKGRVLACAGQAPNHEPVDLATDPLASWIETTFGLDTEPETGRLRRARPISIGGSKGAASLLAERTALPEADCRRAIEHLLLTGHAGAPPQQSGGGFAFRLHQFISRGDTVYASLQPVATRYLTIRKQEFEPGRREHILLPLAFCRECGQEYYVVRRATDPESKQMRYVERDLDDYQGEDKKNDGFLCLHQAEPWANEGEGMTDRLPEDWLENGSDGALRIKRDHVNRLPSRVTIGSDGVEKPQGLLFHYVQAPFAFCLHCGVAYAGRQGDFVKLATLSSGGRSTATTVLSVGTLQGLRSDRGLDPTAHKLLCFTDNRQDASLQAGHLNDFIEVGLLRMALYRAVKEAGEEGITHDRLPRNLFNALKLPFDLYANNPDAIGGAKSDAERALRHVLEYRVYHDLRRGWRVTAPNLEQCGLLRIDYDSLDDLCSDEEPWQGRHEVLVRATPAVRRELCKVLLDLLRHELAIKVEALDEAEQDSLRRRSYQHLKEPWRIDPTEPLTHSYIALPRSKRDKDRREYLFVSGRSRFGQFLRRPATLPHVAQKLTLDESAKVIRSLFETLPRYGLLEEVLAPDEPNGAAGYQLPAARLLWRAGDGTRPFGDPLRISRPAASGTQTNHFFSKFYRQQPATYQHIHAREHTAQVAGDQRAEREAAFRTAKLPLLYCSPTMELGVDIRELNAVAMRNVPPTPANYAQRSGRAGRGGQPALVTTYCTTGSPHDQHYFRNASRMVAGAVAPPRLDMANEDLVRAHVHAIWLRETKQDLHKSLSQILDVNNIDLALALQEGVRSALANPLAKQRAKARAVDLLAPLAATLRTAGWYSDDWVDNVLTHAEDYFDRACNRWRDLYRAAIRQQKQQNGVITDASRSSQDKAVARRLRAEAEAQADLLLSTSDDLYQSDFYSYRYFAAEGFLPGYSFPRLPLSAFLPGRRDAVGARDDFLSRPRFLAISEFGPHSIIYHEGSRYVVDRVILSETTRGDQKLPTTSIKLCPACGYLHQDTGESTHDRCEACGALLEGSLSSLMRMQNVSASRRDRINSDEEERMRMGYDLITAVRMERSEDRPTTRTAKVFDAAGAELFELTYGHAATIWRINRGWRNRRGDTRDGFELDIERGYWAKRSGDDDGAPVSLGPRTQRVLPYVEDRRNCLLIRPHQALAPEVMVSLQPAFKNAIQLLYEVEDNELAAEPLPDSSTRRQFLLYEASEGGAGVLRHLIDDPNALRNVAREALRLCHFDPDSGADLGHPADMTERCEAACYDCLMSYSNQPDHGLLDRHKVQPVLLALAQATIAASPSPESRAQHLARLRTHIGSSLELAWLELVDRLNVRLPGRAQVHREECNCNLDYLYEGTAQAAIFIDGPHHDKEPTAGNDIRINRCLRDAGFTVLRFHWRAQENWATLIAQHEWIFGPIDTAAAREWSANREARP